MQVAQEEFFTPRTLAEFLGVPIATVYAWNHSGRGPERVRVGRHVRYRRRAVERWLEQQTEPNPAA